MSTITERVAAGAAFLDEHDPEWWRADVERAIDVEDLALSMSDRCVLGQRCPLEVLAAYQFSDWDVPAAHDRYQAYAIELSGLLPGSELIHWGYSHGFTLADDGAGHLESLGAWRALTAEWKRVITERRAVA